MATPVDAAKLKAWLSDGGEIALVDVREAGEFGEGHPFFAVPAPYSRFEARLVELVPNPRARLVLVDGGDGVAGRAATRAGGLGYRHVHVLEGGARAWAEAGFTLFEGVNVPSKTFGELVELERRTPHVSAADLKEMAGTGENLVIVDGRPFAEYQTMNIPGGICCPNGELALRISRIAPDPRTRIVVNCAGRTRSIIGAQTLIDLGLRNPVHALEDGTQGWSLAGFELERGADRMCGETAEPEDRAARRARTRMLAEHRGARFVTADAVAGWRADPGRTVFLFDIRSPEEHAADGLPAFVHAPGGQLVQAADRWIGVRGARVVVADSEEVRAPVIAAWLRQMGHEAFVLAGGLGAAGAAELAAGGTPFTPPGRPPVTSGEVRDLMAAGAARLIDLRPSMDYRARHIAGACWSIRPRVVHDMSEAAKTVVLIGEPGIAELAAIDLAEAGASDIRVLSEGPGEWAEAGLEAVASPHEPADADCIDFLSFTHGRHHGDAEASRAYLAWEKGLIGQLDDQERASFRISPPPRV